MAGAPDIRPPADRETPPGRLPDTSEKTGAGYPVAVIWKFPVVPVVRVTWLALVIEGTS